MATTRFFVANVPIGTKENELERLFQDYGHVVKVELKIKENDDNSKIIAFVTLRIDQNDVNYCVNDLSWAKLSGQQIKVSVAKESFLDRLKREREEAEAATSSVPTTNNRSYDEEGETKSALLQSNLENTRKTFSLDADLDDDDIAPELLITKKRAANSLHNGRIVIQKNYDAEPIHVIVTTKKTTKQLDAKATTADQKRKESLLKMKHQYNQNKSAIQQALAGLDAPASKKIKFSDAEEDEEEPSKTDKSKTNIFGSDNEEDGNDENAGLNLKPEYFGKKGEKLIQMQSKQSFDSRFKIDAKFVADDEGDDDQYEDDPNQNVPITIENVEGNEREWQMGILEQVTGTKIDMGNASQKAAKNKKMLRYDPSKDDHQKFLRINQKNDNDVPVQATQNGKNKKQLIKNVEETTNAMAQDDNNAGHQVSKDIFYVVTDTLTESLKTRGDGFSLLNMFGRTDEQLDVRGDQLKKLSKEKIIINNKLDKGTLNPFSYDSSSDSDDEIKVPDAKDLQITSNDTQAKPKKGKVKILMETFFIPKNDARLKEGAKFFKSTKKDDAEENYEDVRNRLKMLIKTKITKTKKNLVVGEKARKLKNKK